MLKLIFCSAIVGFFAGMLYAPLMYFCPLLPLVLVLVGLAVWALGVAVYKLAVWCRVANSFAIAMAGVIAAFFAMYGSWGTSLMLHASEFNVWAFHPISLLNYALTLFEAGSIDIDNEDRTTEIEGVTYVLLWLVELGLFAIAVPYVALREMKSNKRPMCDHCGEWWNVQYGFIRLEYPDESIDTVTDISGSTSHPIWSLPFATVDDDPHVRVDLSGCSQCLTGQSASLCVVSYQTENQELVNNLPLLTDAVSLLRQRHEQFKEFEEEFEEEIDDDEAEYETE